MQTDGLADELAVGTATPRRLESRSAEVPFELIDRILAALRQHEQMREALVEARNVLANSGAESGYCMCGDPVKSHTIGSGHSPVDSHDYMANSTIKKIDEALNQDKPHD